ncbi:hypothetical protein [Pseudoalteromonas sp. S2755]|uniref:hypothetical protein n=1 Tax=Pseudoalteromonas sp. S2755 TaxID=2066523 RepID=UPI00110B478F|nr:hypothetical protein [Pseudoalteromonas sp. S2755]TMN35350.1 hypothetical protein CWC03_15520 [Pseudoalteromonas sp. S2755]
MNKINYLLASLGLVMSVGATANTTEQTSAAELTPYQLDNLQRLPPECCDPRNPRICSGPYIRSSAEGVEPERFTAQSVEPVHVGGARYPITADDMQPLYETEMIFDRCFMTEPQYVQVFRGFEMNLPVAGDYGQDLIFEVTGRVGRALDLSVTCGLGEHTFTLRDSGTKLLVSRRLNTYGTCSNMHIKVRSSSYIPRNVSVDLTVAVYTPLQF